MTDPAQRLIASVYPWQTQNWQKLQYLAAAGRLPHALLLNGPQYIGKMQFARVLAQGLLCSESVSGYACGQCKQCGLLAGDGYPDLVYVAPEAERKPIKVDAIRELGEFLAETAQQGGWKVAIIAPAENMNVNAANALLKNLEEPGPKTLLLLVTHNPSRLPATIRSRCRNLSFTLPDTKLVSDWLRRVLPGRTDYDELVAQSGGKPLWALKLLETGLLEEKMALEQAFDGVASRALEPLDAAAIMMKVDDLIAVDWLQDFIFNRMRQDNRAHKTGLFHYVDKLQSAKRLFTGPGNPNRQLVWEELMLDWQKYSAAK